MSTQSIFHSPISFIPLSHIAKAFENFLPLLSSSGQNFIHPLERGIWESVSKSVFGAKEKEDFFSLTTESVLKRESLIFKPEQLGKSCNVKTQDCIEHV